MDLRRWNRIPYDAYQLSTEEEITRYEKPYSFQVAGKDLVITQSKVKGQASVGFAIWDASLVLAKYLEKREISQPGFLKNKKVIELGAGCGISGMTAVILGANVIFTDTEKIIPQLKQNVDNNLQHIVNNNENQSQFAPYTVQELTWGKTSFDNFERPFHFILGADVIYHKKAVKPLLKAAFELANEESEFLLAFEVHDTDSAKYFWKFSPRLFTVTKIPSSELDPFYQDPKINAVLLKRRNIEVLRKEFQEDYDTELAPAELAVRSNTTGIAKDIRDEISKRNLASLSDSDSDDFCEGNNFSENEEDDEE